jgi:hypothetical protein
MGMFYTFCTAYPQGLLQVIIFSFLNHRGHREHRDTQSCRFIFYIFLSACIITFLIASVSGFSPVNLKKQYTA